MPAACKKCYWCARHVGGINFWANIGLFIIKLLGGILGRSQALIADSVHSLSDIIVAILVIVSLKVSSSPPDEDHHWGHGHIEFVVSAIIGTVLVCTAITITMVSLVSIVRGDMYDPGILAVWAAAIAIVANEIMFRHSLCAGEQIGSPVLIANAWENRADVWTSVAALAGILGARMGFTFFDPAAAILVGFVIARNGVDTLVVGVKGITDRSFDDKAVLTQVKKMVLNEEEIKDVSRLRVRQIGQKNWVDIEVLFDPQIKVSEVKRIIEKIKKNVREKFERIGDVVIVSRVAKPELKEI